MGIPRSLIRLKNSFQADASFSDIVDYFKVWAIQGTCHPVSYLKATCRATSVQRILSRQNDGLAYYCNPGKSSLEMFSRSLRAPSLFTNPEALNVASSKIEKAYKEILNHMPWQIGSSPKGFYGGWLPMLCILAGPCIMTRETSSHFVPILGSWVFLIMTPTVADRYILPFL